MEERERCYSFILSWTGVQDKIKLNYLHETFEIIKLKIHLKPRIKQVTPTLPGRGKQKHNIDMLTVYRKLEGKLQK
jgi:hypothetical protein